jgi:hypothetical protein
MPAEIVNEERKKAIVYVMLSKLEVEEGCRR